MSRLRDVAQTYVGTPHINAGNIKGVGLDCCTLPARIINEVYGINFPTELNYTADWFCRRDCKEILLPLLRQYCVPVSDLEEGDVISYEWGRSKYAHLALYLGAGKVIHCSADEGTVITYINNTCFCHPDGRSRMTGIWRLRDELIQKD